MASVTLTTPPMLKIHIKRKPVGRRTRRFWSRQACMRVMMKGAVDFVPPITLHYTLVRMTQMVSRFSQRVAESIIITSRNRSYFMKTFALARRTMKSKSSDFGVFSWVSWIDRRQQARYRSMRQVGVPMRAARVPYKPTITTSSPSTPYPKRLWATTGGA